jgi:formylglycine-generating enzyme required for sulfatase activity
MRKLRLSTAILGFLAACVLIAGPQSTVSTTRESRTGMEFVRIAPGIFFMGCSDGDGLCDPDEKPSHDVRITKEFELGKYEVTQGQWRRVIDRNPSVFKGDDLPVENVSWNDVQEFLKQMNMRRDGYRYRLPTEAEWEYAARAGSAGPNAGNLDDIAWYAGTLTQESRPVGRKQPNRWGLYDVQGNVWEWVEDWYGENFYPNSPASDPVGPRTGEYHVMRGGAWGLIPYYLRLSYRDANLPTYKDNSIGFRVARERNP